MNRAGRSSVRARYQHPNSSNPTQRNGETNQRRHVHDGGFLCTWVADFDFALGFCGVPSTRTIGPFGCARVVELLAVAVAVAVSASAFAGGGTVGPSLRRFLKTFDMLTSRCRTLRGLDSVRRIPAASCSSETERERERDCAALRLVPVWAFAFVYGGLKSIGGSGPWTD